MALNTPKRIKIFKTIFNSPGSDCGTVWRDYESDASGLNNHTSFLSTSFCSIDSNGSASVAGTTGSLSPASSCDSPETNSSRQPISNLNGSGNSVIDGRESRRGRPRSEALTTLMIEGSTSPSAIKCTYCNRVFPREKSLQAHLRTHTGEFAARFWSPSVLHLRLFRRHFLFSVNFGIEIRARMAEDGSGVVNSEQVHRTSDRKSKRKRRNEIVKWAWACARACVAAEII